VRPFECRRGRLQLIGSTDAGQVNAVEAAVAGFTDAGRKEGDSHFLFLPLALAQRLRNSQDISQYMVRLVDPSKAERFAADLMVSARARGLSIDAMPWKASYHGRIFVQGMGVLGVFRRLMAIVVVAIVGMAIFTTMAKAVTARTREVGTLRSLGFFRRHLIALFALEAALLSAVACALGLAVTLGVTALVNRAGLTYEGGIASNPLPLGVAVDLPTYAWIAACLIGVSVLAAWLPARRAVRRKIPDALAYA
jgi:putative ABC transport system permease protein